MHKYLDLDRRFGLLTSYTPTELFASDVLGKRLAWERVLEGRFSVIVARANFGKTMELKERSNALRAQGKAAVFVALHKLLGDDEFNEALDPEDDSAYAAWLKAPEDELTVLVDSLDEALLAREDGLRVALRRVAKAVRWPSSDIRWVLSARPAVLTSDVLELLQAELRTTLYSGSKGRAEQQAFEDAFDEDGDATATSATERPSDAEEQPGDLNAAGVGSKVENEPVKHEQLKVYSLLALDRRAAARYLIEHCGAGDPNATLEAAWQYGLGRLGEGPGGLDVLAYVDPANCPPHDLTEAFNKMVEAMQQQQRADPRERLLGSPPPEKLDEAIERLASASAVCQLPNIELSPVALRFREGVLSARHLIASLLSEQSMTYLLGSRLFIDSGQHQVKVYPDELLPFLAAKRLASRAMSPEDAARLIANFTWRATTGECGVYRVFLPLAGWLATLNSHCRQELLRVDPQAVAFFGDLRNPSVQLADADKALQGAIERLVGSGDSLGRAHYTLTAENYWQAGKEGIEPTLRVLFDKYGTDWHARDALLDIASHAALDVFREAVLDTHSFDYSKLVNEAMDLHYILALGRQDDLEALAGELLANPQMPETQVARLLSALAWKPLDAREIAQVVTEQLKAGHGIYSLDWTITRGVADEADARQLYALARSLLLRLVNTKVPKGHGPDQYRADEKFVELMMDMLALVIKRGAAAPSRAAKLCLVLNRYVQDNHHGSADTKNLRAALEANQAVRVEFTRGLIHPTDKTPDGILKAIFWYDPLCPIVDGDEIAVAEPGFTQIIEERRKRAAAPPPPVPARRGRGLELGEQSRAQLQGMVDGLRDGSKDGALAWIAGWLTRTIQQSRYSECNFSLFEQEAGAEVAEAVRTGLGALWRSQDPTWKEDEPNSTYNITIAGLQGLHLDLGDGSKLPSLTEQDVRRAIRYAQFEINGYPKWFWLLVQAHERIASEELAVILDEAKAGRVSSDKAETLIRRLDEAPEAVQRSLGLSAWNFILSNSQVAEYTTEAALKIALANTGLIDQVTFESEAWRRMSHAFDEELPVLSEQPLAADEETIKARQALETKLKEMRPQRSNAVVWGGFWLWHFPGSFGQACAAWRGRNQRAAEEFMFDLAVHLGEDRNVRLKHVAESGSIGLKTLKMLYEWVRSVVKEENDIKHENGRTYSVGARDQAQRLRDALVPAISHAKSEEAYVILEELRRESTESLAKYLRYVQFMMREEQASKAPLPQRDYPAFETNFAPPVSDYMTFAMAVHTDLLAVKSQIETGDFSLRRFFNSLNFNRIKTDKVGLALEEDFQALLGSELNHAAANRYTVTLEPILPESTRRDVLCQVGSFRATVELKMSVRWTLADYSEALEKQLQGQYMQAPNSKIGFFVVVLQKARTWYAPDGGRIEFPELLKILAQKAQEFEVADRSVYLRVIGIDATPKEDFRAAKKKSRRVAKSADALPPPRVRVGEV